MLPMTFLTGARGARVRNFALPVAVETTAAAGLRRRGRGGARDGMNAVLRH